MINVDKFIKYSMYFLLFWYVISPFIWINDETLSFDLKIVYSLINYSILMMLIRVLVYEYKKPNFSDFSMTFMMIIWFFYSTYRDAVEPGYYFLLKLFYISIDLLSTVFLIDTFVNFLLNSNIFILNSVSMKDINMKMKILLATIFSIVYFQIYRHIR